MQNANYVWCLLICLFSCVTSLSLLCVFLFLLISLYSVWCESRKFFVVIHDIIILKPFGCGILWLAITKHSKIFGLYQYSTKQFWCRSFLCMSDLFSLFFCICGRIRASQNQSQSLNHLITLCSSFLLQFFLFKVYLNNHKCLATVQF